MDREVGLRMEFVLETSKEGIFAASIEMEQGLAVLSEIRGLNPVPASAVWASALKHLRNAEQSIPTAKVQHQRVQMN